MVGGSRSNGGELLLSTSGDQVGEGLVVDLQLLNWGLSLAHGRDLLIIKRLSSLVGKDLDQLVLGDLATVLLVEHGEGSNDGCLGVSSCESLSEEGEEDGEVDGSGCFLDHGLDLGVRGDGSHGSVQILQILLKNDSVLVLVHDAEGLLELLDGLLIELSGLRSRSLLGGLLLGGLG
ncbi:hypothetical protein PFISCL1PPCAC_27235, partial [Pristionchus fissidentatus]